MEVLGKSFGGDETNLTAEVTDFEARSEEKEDGIEKGELEPWDTQAEGTKRERLPRVGWRDKGKGGPPQDDLWT